MANIEQSYVTTISADDYPGRGNQGLQAAGESHLEKHGFKEGERVRVTITIETEAK